jgi:uroporphyrinogen III methyltransferase/synthase
MLSRLKLEGIRVVWTGLRESGDAIIDALEKEGALVERLPLLTCVPVQSIDPLPLISPKVWAVFTSARAVETVFQQGCDLSSANIAAVGPSTANKLREIGLEADIVPNDVRAQGLVEAMIEKTHSNAEVIFFRGDKALTLLPDRLRKAGFHVVEKEVYTTHPIAADEAKRVASHLIADTDAAIFGSPSGVQVLTGATPLSELVKAAPLLLFAALGPTTAAALKAAGVERPVISPSPNPEDVVQSIIKRTFEANSLPGRS